VVPEAQSWVVPERSTTVTGSDIHILVFQSFVHATKIASYCITIFPSYGSEHRVNSSSLIGGCPGGIQSPYLGVPSGNISGASSKRL
jgi:hypothetical protein